jgi:hypothetical protein
MATDPQFALPGGAVAGDIAVLVASGAQPYTPTGFATAQGYLVLVGLEDGVGASRGFGTHKVLVAADIAAGYVENTASVNVCGYFYLLVFRVENFTVRAVTEASDSSGDDNPQAITLPADLTVGGFQSVSVMLVAEGCELNGRNNVPEVHAAGWPPTLTTSSLSAWTEVQPEIQSGLFFLGTLPISSGDRTLGFRFRVLYKLNTFGDNLTSDGTASSTWGAPSPINGWAWTLGAVMYSLHTTLPAAEPTTTSGLQLRLLRMQAPELPYQLHTRMIRGIRGPRLP